MVFVFLGGGGVGDAERVEVLGGYEAFLGREDEDEEEDSRGEVLTVLFVE